MSDALTAVRAFRHGREGENPVSKTDDFSASLNAQERALFEKREGRTPSLRDDLRLWEWCGDVLSDDGTMMAYEFINTLDTRTAIENAIDDLPASLSEKLRIFLTALDERYRECTVEDGGQEVSKYADRDEDVTMRWWFTRRPARFPAGW